MVYAWFATSASVHALRSEDPALAFVVTDPSFFVPDPAHAVLPLGDLDVLVRRLEVVRHDPLRLVLNLLCGAGDRLAADRERARAVRVLAERPGVRVAVDDVDDLRRDAEAIGDDLGEARLEPLPVRRGAGVDGHRPGRVHADLG